MRLATRTCTGLATLAVALAAACGSCGRGGAARVHVTGRLVDAESGRPVARTAIWVHGFNDELAADAPARKDSLEPAEASDFELALAAPEIRLRIADKSNEYELFEQRYVASGDRLDVEVRLQPTHWLRLHGQLLLEDDGQRRPLPHDDGAIGSRPFLELGPAVIHADAGSRYDVRVPRILLRVLALDTGRRVLPAELDLRGATEDERTLDFVLVK